MPDDPLPDPPTRLDRALDWGGTALFLATSVAAGLQLWMWAAAGGVGLLAVFVITVLLGRGR